MSRRLDSTNTSAARAATPDIKVCGDPDMWELLCKASSERHGWMKCTKRCKVTGGWLYQVTTEHRRRTLFGLGPSVVVSCAEAIAFVPDAW